jgi:fatty acid desaturase
MKSGYIEQRLKFLHDDTYLQKRDSLLMALHSTLHIIITWGVIFLILYINNTFINIYLNLFSIFIIGAVQHRFFTIYHEAFHYNLFRNKRLNDNAAMFFASFPSFSTYKNAKLRHLNHHFRTATKEDPERVSHISNINDFISIIFPHFQTLKKILINFGFRLNINVIEGRKESNLHTNNLRMEIFLFIVFNIFFLMFLIFAFRNSFYIYYIGIFFTMPIFSSIRSWVEHYNSDQDELPAHRVIIYCNFIERFLFAPMSFNYHLIHHANMNIPHFKLKYASIQYKDLLDNIEIRRTSYIKTFIKHFILK